MAKKGLMIADVKKMKAEMEADILKMVKAFEKDTGIRVSYINFDRDYPEDKYPEVVEEKNYPLKNVSINMDLDIIY